MSSQSTLQTCPSATHQQGEALALVLGEARRAVGAAHRRVLQCRAAGQRGAGFSRPCGRVQHGGRCFKSCQPLSLTELSRQLAIRTSSQLPGRLQRLPEAAAGGLLQRWAVYNGQPDAKQRLGASPCSARRSGSGGPPPMLSIMKKMCHTYLIRSMPHHVLPEGQPAAGEPGEVVAQGAPIPVGRRRAQVKALRSLLQEGVAQCSSGVKPMGAGGGEYQVKALGSL